MAVRLRDRVTVQRPTYVTNANNNAKVIDPNGWVDVARFIGAAVEILGGTEVIEGQRVTGKTFYKLTVRYNENITEKCRVRICGGPTIQLSEAVPQDMRRHYMILSGTETKEPT